MSGATIQAGLTSTLATALATDTAVVVVNGAPGPTAEPDVVAVTDVRAEADRDEETFSIGIVVSCYVGGGREAQAVATVRAYSLLGSIDTAIYNSPTLGGVARVAELDTEHRAAEAIAMDASGRVPVGRLTEISTAVTVWSGRTLLGSLKSAHRV